MAMSRDADKERWWRKAVARQAASRLSVRAFCDREGLAESAFYFWRRTLAQRDAGGAKPAFVPAIVTAARSDTRADTQAAITIELAGGCRARLVGDAAVEQLAELAMALQARAAR
jgi:transposase-like protein